jgi:hypothetical protein
VSYEIPIEQGKIREFARATSSKLPAHNGPAAVIPPTFLTTARLVWEPSDQNPAMELGFDMARVLHGEEEYTFYGPPPQAGQTLTAASRMGERYEKEGKRGGVMRFAVMCTEFRDAAGALVAEQRSTVVETAAPPMEA